MMTNAERLRDALTYAVIIVVGFLALQFVVVVSHEFTHSIMSWLLGQMDNPLDIVWGNPLTLTGWDQGVEYTQMFATGQFVEAAIIGVSPLVMHSTVVSGGLVRLAAGISSKPTTATSPGMASPASPSARIAPIAMRSLAAKIASNALPLASSVRAA